MLIGMKLSRVINDIGSKSKFIVTIDGHLIEQVEYTKFLSVFVDAKLDMDHIALKISKGLGAMGRARNILPRNALLMLYFTMIYPYLNYCNIIWGSANSSTLHKLVCLQNRAMRLITRSKFRVSCDPLFVSLRLLKLSDINRLQTAQFMFRYKHHHLPISCMRYVTVAVSHRFHDTRKAFYFIMEGFRTVIRENSVSIRGPRLLDSLTREIQDSPSIGQFKHQLINMFIDSYKR